jgi:predicted alpha/beta superfamily hydrolase
MRTMWIGLALGVALVAPVRAQQKSVHLEPATVRGAMEFDLASQATGRTYRIFIHKPTSAPPAAGYPVVFLTDGELTFGPAFTRTGLEGLVMDLRPVLIVAIAYATPDPNAWMKLRTGDLTPTAPPKSENDPVDVGGSGNAESFYHFITDELRPALTAVAPMDPADQTLYGHSLGGLFALHVLFTHPNAFRTYVASSPSIWWDHRSVLKEEAGFVAEVNAGKCSPRLLILSAGQEQTIPTGPLPEGTTLEQMKKLIPEARMIDNARELADRLRDLKGKPPYEVSFHLFEGESHSTVIPASISRGLDFAVGIRQY